MGRTATTAACALVALLVAPSVAPGAGGFKFEGRTNQCPADQGRCGGVTVNLARSLTRVRSFAIEFQAKCQNAPTPITDALTARDFRASVTAHTVKFAHRASSSLDLGNGVTGDVSATLRGQLRAATGKGSGTLVLEVTVRNAAGQTIDTCTTGTPPVRWTVSIV